MLNHFRTEEDTTLVLSPALQRAQRHLRDLITIACENYMQAPSKSLYLTRCEYVSDAKYDGKFCMHLNLLVREQGRDDAITISLNITADAGGK